MANEKKDHGWTGPLAEGHKPTGKRGFQPIKGNLNSSKPPQGGSGVPSKPSSTGGKVKEK